MRLKIAVIGACLMGMNHLRVLRDLDEESSCHSTRWSHMVAGLSTGFIDECYALALERGTSAGKITGAGGGSFLLIHCQEQAQDAVTGALEDRGLKRMNFRFDHAGATVVLNVASFNKDWVVLHAA